MRPTTAAGVLACLAFVIGTACSDSSRTPTSPSAPPDTPSTGNPPPGTSPPAPGTPPFTPTGATVQVLAAADIGMCSERVAVERTATLVDRFSGPVFIAGDIGYMHGTYQNFIDCFDPAWGRFRNRWYPVPGNHEYETPNAAGYRQYFSETVLAHGRTFYSVRTGDWLVLMIDSSLPVRVGSEQYEWARLALQSTRAGCTMAVWHHPLFSSGPNGPSRFMRELWSLLYEHDADVVIAGHDHLYERFGKQDVDGRSDARGLRQFIVGTGGANLYDFQRQEPNSQARHRMHGVLRLTLLPTSYQWSFVDVNGATLDSGADGCH